MWDKTKSPCLNCGTREIGCHSRCKKYSEFREFKEGIRAVEIEYKENIDYQWDSIKRACSFIR